MALDLARESEEVVRFKEELGSKIIGQPRVIKTLAGIYQKHLAGLSQPDKPVANLLFLGPTGSGKTRTVLAAAETLYGSVEAVIKIDCGEYTNGHEVAKLVGSPPGYVGHMETSSIFSQKLLDQFTIGEDLKLAFLLFDEIEKANDKLWKLLLGIMDKAMLTLGNNNEVDFSSCILVMTGNLGSKEISQLVGQTKKIGFATGMNSARYWEEESEEREELDQKIYKAAIEAARKNFPPEFINRMDKVVVFRALTRKHLEQIFDIEMQQIQDMILSRSNVKFVLKCDSDAKKMIIEEGFDPKYGARHLKRNIDRLLVIPLSNLIASKQIKFGDLVVVKKSVQDRKLEFSKAVGETFITAEFKKTRANRFASKTN